MFIFSHFGFINLMFSLTFPVFFYYYSNIKKKNTQGSIKLNSPVTCFDFSPNGDMMIFGTGNDWNLGLNGL